MESFELMPHRAHADRVEIELIRSLYDAFVPSVIMSAGFALCGAVIVGKAGDPILLALWVGGMLASAARLVIAWRDRRRARAETLAIADARRLGRRFATGYGAFAIFLGLFGARTFWLSMPDLHMLMMCLLVGYAAGVAAGIGRRPRIAVPAMLLAVVPPVVVALARADAVYVAAALMTAAFLAGGIHSLLGRHARAAADIGRRLTFAALARQDVLTALPNRLALREWFDLEVAASGRDGELIAVHCLDLNGFKPINDSFGHPAGDKLLAMVAKRLARTIRETDIAARIGGDEFAIVQRGIADADEAALLAERIVAAVERPFRLGDTTISISTCIGYVVPDGEFDLEQLLGCADEALYAAKRGGSCVRAWRPTPLRAVA